MNTAILILIILGYDMEHKKPAYWYPFMILTLSRFISLCRFCAELQVLLASDFHLQAPDPVL